MTLQEILISDLVFSYYLEENKFKAFSKWRIKKIWYSAIIQILFFKGCTE